MIFGADNLIDLINRPLADAGVQKLLSVAGAADRKIKIKRGDSDAAIDCPEHGMVFNFEEAADTANLPEGTLVLTTIHAMAAGVENHTGFKGTLPHGLRFDMTRADVRRILGQPDWTSPVLPIDRWNEQGYQIVVDFFEGDTAAIASVVVQRPR